MRCFRLAGARAASAIVVVSRMYVAGSAENTTTDAAVERAAVLLREASKVLFITGAGISVASGLPTYRGVGGLYSDSTTIEGYSIEEALSAEVFEVRPEVTWKYLRQMGSGCIKAQPNRAHYAITRLQQWIGDRKGRSWVVTQNIDGLHLAAGNKNVVQLHGNAMKFRCLYCTATGLDVQQCGLEAYATPVPTGRDASPIPHCPKCKGIVRPNVILFNEYLPVDELRKFHSADPDCTVVIGTTTQFQYIMGPVLATMDRGGSTIEINPGEGELSGDVTVHVKLPAVEALDGILVKLGL